MSSSVKQDPQSFLNEQIKDLNKRARALEEAAPGDVIAETIQLGDPAILLDGVGDASIAGNLYVGGIVMEGCRVYHSSSQSVSNNTETILSFNSESYDTDNMHDLSVNNSRATINTPGKYLLLFHGSWSTSTVTDGWFAFYLNGSTYVSFYRNVVMIGAVIAATADLVVGDYVQVIVKQQTGGSINVIYNAQISPYFTVQRVG